MCRGYLPGITSFVEERILFTTAERRVEVVLNSFQYGGALGWSISFSPNVESPLMVAIELWISDEAVFIRISRSCHARSNTAWFFSSSIVPSLTFLSSNAFTFLFLRLFLARTMVRTTSRVATPAIAVFAICCWRIISLLSAKVLFWDCIRASFCFSRFSAWISSNCSSSLRCKCCLLAEYTCFDKITFC